MTKKELIADLAEQTQTSKADAARHLDALIDITRDTLVSGGTLHLPGICKLFTKLNPAKTLNGPIGHGLSVPERRVVRMKVSDLLRKDVAAHS